jgi:uncharacterized membrane-anchored protein YhcB (DUF1043 family)
MDFGITMFLIIIVILICVFGLLVGIIIGFIVGRTTVDVNNTARSQWEIMDDELKEIDKNID